jgi:hypothetical protein
MLKLFEVQNNTPEHRPYELLLALSVCHPLTFSIFFIIFYRTFESLTNDDGSQVFKFVCISAVKDHVFGVYIIVFPRCKGINKKNEIQIPSSLCYFLDTVNKNSTTTGCDIEEFTLQ